MYLGGKQLNQRKVGNGWGASSLLRLHGMMHNYFLIPGGRQTNYQREKNTWNKLHFPAEKNAVKGSGRRRNLSRISIRKGGFTWSEKIKATQKKSTPARQQRNRSSDYEV